MYKDIINYQLAENITETHLLQVGKVVLESWMNKLPGFISWEINKNADGSYTDIVCWSSEKDIENAEKQMVNVPNAEAWLSCYEKKSISSRKLRSLIKF